MKRGLGKGLDVLIPPSAGSKTTSGKQTDTPAQDQEKIFVSIQRVEPNRAQPRKAFDEDALEELADSIRQVGILEPILVRERNDRYDIIAGERRWRAAKLAGLKEVPVIVRNDLTEQQIVEIQLIENIQRENLNPIEEAQAYERLIREFHMKQDEVADRVSKSRVTVTNSMRLLKLCPAVQQMVIDGMLKTGQARALISVEDTEVQLSLAQRIFDENLSTREAEKIVRQLDTPAKRKREQKKNESLEAVYRSIEERLKNAIGTKATITSKGTDGAGKLELEFYNHDDLEMITERLLRG